MQGVGKFTFKQHAFHNDESLLVDGFAAAPEVLHVMCTCS